MKRVRTTIILYVTTLIFGGYAGFIVDLSDSERKNLGHDNTYNVSVTTADESLLRQTYQPINQPSARDDSESLSFDVTLSIGGAGNQQVDTTVLISTPFKDSCESNATHNELLPAWKIDNNVREFRLKINQRTTQELEVSTLFLCVYNEYLGRMQHLGERSALTFGR